MRDVSKIEREFGDKQVTKDKECRDENSICIFVGYIIFM